MVVPAIAIALALVVAWSSAPACSAEITLRFSSASPAGSRNSVFFRRWAQRVGEQSAGTLRIEVRDGTAFAGFGNVYDRVDTDVVQIGWGIHQVLAGKFPLTELLSLPIRINDWESASAAFWRLYKMGYLGGEYRRIVPLCLFFFGPAQIHFAKLQRRSFTDLRGLKIGVAAKFPSELVSRAGGTPISLTPAQAYQSLHRRTIDGVAFSWAGVAAYKLDEVAKFHLGAPMGGGTGMIFMSRKKYESLPAPAREALASGERMSRVFARHFQAEWTEQRARIARSPKHKIAQLTTKERRIWETKWIAPVRDTWANSRSHGREVLDAFHRLISQVAVGR